jgi:hypothetical protein
MTAVNGVKIEPFDIFRGQASLPACMAWILDGENTP